jgi:hypothetical protein
MIEKFEMFQGRKILCGWQNTYIAIWTLNKNSYMPGLLLCKNPLTANPVGTAYLLEDW